MLAALLTHSEIVCICDAGNVLALYKPSLCERKIPLSDLRTIVIS